MNQAGTGPSAADGSTPLQPHRVRVDDVAGRPVRSLEAGHAESPSPPVVVIPGLGALGYLFDSLHGCSAGARAFLLDVPGFGHPPPWPCAPELPELVRLVAGWLRTVCEGPAVVFGHSTGAQIALKVAVRAPDMVSGLVLGGPTFPPALRTLPALAHAFARNSRYEPPGLLRVTLPYYRRAGPRAVLRYIRSAQQDEPERNIGLTTCPVTVVRGKNDAFSPADWSSELAGSAPRGQLVTVPGAHTFPYAHGGLTASLVAGVSPP